jgi:metal-responsive CopG/Arc/MetJ family transcriptional regulator
MKRLNITLPETICEKLNAYRNKSNFIAEALAEKLEREERKKLEKLLIEGYKMTTKEDKKINREWEKITIKGWICR